MWLQSERWRRAVGRKQSAESRKQSAGGGGQGCAGGVKCPDARRPAASPLAALVTGLLKQFFIIGDIHGCHAELLDLLDAAGLSTGDELIALGDIVDRGPQSPAVLDYFRAQPHARSILGNHERKHVRSFRGELAPARSQKITRQQFGEAAYPAAVAMMAGFPSRLELDDAILVHGFWEPGRPLAEQRENVVVGTLSGDAYLKARYGQPWYAHYDGPKPLIVGHHNYLQSDQPLVYRERVFGLDTGCCYGGALTGLLLPSFRLVSVPSRGNHWLALRQAFPLPPPPPPAARPQWTATDERLLERLREWVAAEDARVWAALSQDVDFAWLSVRQQGRVYAEHVGQRPEAPLLHLARRGELTVERMQAALRTPEVARALAKGLGLLPEA